MLVAKIASVFLFILFLPAVVFADSWDSMVWDGDYWSILEIKANGQADNVTISQPSNLSITVQINPAEYPGINADLWIVALANSDWYYLNSSIQWTPFDGNLSNIHSVYSGALFNLPVTEVLNMTGLPVGLYTFWFAVDYPMDGVLNADGQILVDSVKVTVQ